MFLSALAACSSKTNFDKNLLYGTWTASYSNEEEGIHYDIDETVTFNKNGSVQVSLETVMKFMGEKLTFNVEINGKYSYKSEYITYEIKKNDINVDIDPDLFETPFEQRQAVKEFKEILAEEVTTEKVVNLTETQLITIDDDGLEITYTKVSYDDEITVNDDEDEEKADNNSDDQPKDVYAHIVLPDDRRITLKTDHTIPEFSLDADWKITDGAIVIFTGEGTSFLTIIDGILYEGRYEDGKCWIEEWVGGKEGEEGSLEDVGYTPVPSKGKRLKGIKIYQKSDLSGNLSNNTRKDDLKPLSIKNLLKDNNEYLSYRDPKEYEKIMTGLGATLYSTQKLKVSIGTDEPNMCPAVKKIYKRPTEEVSVTNLNSSDWNNVDNIEILFTDSEAQTRFIADLVKNGWNKTETLSNSKYEKKGFSINIDKNLLTFDTGF